MNAETTSAALLWQEWHQQRLQTVMAPYGPLSVTGTHWLADADDEGRIAGVPGRWRQSPDGTAVTLTADVMDGLAVDGELLAGQVTLTADRNGPGQARVSYGERRLELLSREGQWAVRVHDPASAARRGFPGIRTSPYEARWALAGVLHPYATDDSERSVRVANTDGHARGLELGGELEFSTPDGGWHTLRVSVVGSGALWAVFADGTSGRTSYRFRFLRTGAPAPDGSVTVDFNRATLPPCAFTDHFLCPFPPPGNTLTVDIPVGERDIAE